MSLARARCSAVAQSGKPRPRLVPVDVSACSDPALRRRLIWHTSDGSHGTVPGARNGQNGGLSCRLVSLGVTWTHHYGALVQLGTSRTSSGQLLCATRCHVVPPSASYGRLMPRGAGLCHVFGGAFTVRLAVDAAWCEPVSANRRAGSWTWPDLAGPGIVGCHGRTAIRGRVHLDGRRPRWA